MEPTPSGQANDKEGMDGEEGQKQNRGYIYWKKKCDASRRKDRSIPFLVVNKSPALHLYIPNAPIYKADLLKKGLPPLSKASWEIHIPSGTGSHGRRAL